MRKGRKGKGRTALCVVFLMLLFGFLWTYPYELTDIIKGRIREEGGSAGGEVQERTAYFYDESDQGLLLKYQEYNPDVAGLITIPDTVLNHPVMQTKEDEAFYLTRDLDKNPNSHGVPFLSKESRMEGEGGNRIIYGHNIHKISRDVFADLGGYEDLDFYKRHPVIRTVSESGTRKWLIFAYFLVDNGDKEPFRYSETTDFLSQQEFDAYFSEVDKRNWLFVPVERSIEDTYLTLSSCSYELSGSGTNRMVVMAKQLYVGEPYLDTVRYAAMRKSPLLPERLECNREE